ncbi:MAG: isoprenoid biosynthesis glyoxalase ElbB [Cyclobacteriaceae bacterium]|nr:isoprenoid biosynthesis glyoxalase ElbB [Cyclobacteriaceae bacterium]
MKIGVLLSGNGVYDGSEIQEAVFTLLAIDELNGESVCMAPDVEQHHVLNHITGDEMAEKRNVLIESARIARGNIRDLAEVKSEDLDALVLPGGFGAAKNLTKWAFSGPDGEILPEVRSLINEMVLHGKPVCGLCMGPTVIAKALEDTSVHPDLTIGTTEEASPYEIDAINAGINKTGSHAVMKKVTEILIDRKNKIVTAPCYMMEASISEIRNNVRMAIEATFSLIKTERQKA